MEKLRLDKELGGGGILYLIKEVKVVEEVKKIKTMIRKNSMLLLGIILGGVIFGGGVYAATVASSSVSYSNSTSGLSATNVQSAIDELYSNTTTLKGEKVAGLCGISLYDFAVANMASNYISNCSTGIKNSSPSTYTTAVSRYNDIENYCYLYYLKTSNSNAWKMCCSSYCSKESTCTSVCQNLI